MKHVASVTGFALSVGLTAVVTLLLVPVVIHHAGAAAWADLALGQAVGSAVAIVIGFGWAANGPTTVARASAAERLSIVRDSLRSRAVLIAPALVAGMTVAGLLALTAPLESLLTAAAFGLTGMLNGWFFAGEARPYALLVMETVPRVGGTVVGLLALMAGSPLWVLPAAQLVGVLVAAAISAIRLLSRYRGAAVPKSPKITSILAAQRHGMTVAAASAVWIALPVSVVAVLAPAALPSYALADKLLRFATTAWSPVIQFFQGWVPARDLPTFRRRMQIAVAISSGLLLVAAVLFVVLAEPIYVLLGSGQVHPILWVMIGLAGVLVFGSLGNVIGLVGLTGLGLVRAFSRIVAGGAILAVPALFLFTAILGPAGTAGTAAVIDAACLAIGAVLLARAFATTSSESSQPRGT